MLCSYEEHCEIFINFLPRNSPLVVFSSPLLDDIWLCPVSGRLFRGRSPLSGVSKFAGEESRKIK